MAFKVVLLVVLLAPMSWAVSSDVKVNSLWFRRQRSGSQPAHRRPSRQADLDSGYVGTYGVKLRLPTHSTQRPSKKTAEDFTRPSVSFTAPPDGRPHDVTAEPEGQPDDDIVSTPTATDASATSAASLAYTKQKHGSTGSLTTHRPPSIRLDDGEHAHFIAPHQVASSFSYSPADVTSLPFRELKDDTLYFEVVESRRAAKISNANNVSPHVNNTDLGDEYPPVDLKAVFREYARQEGVTLNGRIVSSVDINPAPGLKSEEKSSSGGAELSFRVDLSKTITQSRLVTEDVSPQQGTGITVSGSNLPAEKGLSTITGTEQQLTKANNRLSESVTDPADLAGYVAADERMSQGVTEENKEDQLKSRTPQSVRITVPSQGASSEFPISKPQRTSAPVLIPLRKGHKGSTAGIFRREQEVKPVPAAISFSDQPQTRYRFNRFRYSAPVLVGGEPDAAVYVDESYPQRHIVISHAHFNGHSVNNEDVVRSAGQGHQFKYANAAPTVHGGVVYVYEDDKSPPTQVVIPCVGCQSKQGYLSVVGDIDGRSLIDVEPSGGRSSRGQSRSPTDEPRFGRSFNTTQSRKGVKISGSYETEGPVGHLQLAEDYGPVTFRGHVPSSLDGGKYYSPLPGTNGFLPTAFSYNPRVFHGHSFSGYIHRPARFRTTPKNKRSSLTQGNTKRLNSSSVTKRVDVNVSRYSSTNLSSTMTKESQNQLLPYVQMHSVENKRTESSTVLPDTKPSTSALGEKQAVPNRRHRRATFQKVHVPHRRRPITSAPRAPPTIGQLTRGQRYTVLNDIHANMRQSRRMHTSTPQPTVISTTTESDRELRELTMQMIRNLRDEKLASYRSESAEYKAALTAQLKEQLLKASSGKSTDHENHDLTDNLKETSNQTEIVTIQPTEDSHSSQFDVVVSTQNFSAVNSDEDAETSTTPSEKTKGNVQQNLRNDSYSNVNQLNETEPVDVKQNKTVPSQLEWNTLNSPRESTIQKGRSREREFKKAERNAELAIQLKEKLLRESKAHGTVSVTAGHRLLKSSANIRNKNKPTNTNPSWSAAAMSDADSLNRLVLVTVKQKTRTLGTEDLSNFGKALNTSRSISEQKPKNLEMTSAPPPGTKDLRDTLHLHQAYANIGTPEDYVRHVMLHDAISDGTFLHVAAVEEATPEVFETFADEPIDTGQERYPFESSLALPKIVHTDYNLDGYETYDSPFGNEFDYTEADNEDLLTDNNILVYADNEITTNNAGFKSDPRFNLNIVSSGDPTGPLLSEESLPPKTTSVQNLQNSHSVIDRPKSSLKVTSSELPTSSHRDKFPKSPTSADGDLVSKHHPRHPLYHSRFPGAVGRPENHPRRPVHISRHPPFGRERIPNTRPGSSGHPKPGAHSVLADRPIHNAFASEDTSDDSLGNIFGNTDDPKGADVNSKETAEFPSDADLRHHPRPGLGPGGMRPRPGHGPRPGHYHRRPIGFRRPGPGRRPLPRRPPHGFLRRMYHRMMHGFNRMMSAPRMVPRRRPAAGPQGMRGLLGIYRGGKKKTEEEES